MRPVRERRPCVASRSPSRTNRGVLDEDGADRVRARGTVERGRRSRRRRCRPRPRRVPVDDRGRSLVLFEDRAASARRRARRRARSLDRTCRARSRSSRRSSRSRRRAGRPRSRRPRRGRAPRSSADRRAQQRPRPAPRPAPARAARPSGCERVGALGDGSTARRRCPSRRRRWRRTRPSGNVRREVGRARVISRHRRDPEKRPAELRPEIGRSPVRRIRRAGARTRPRRAPGEARSFTGPRRKSSARTAPDARSMLRAVRATACSASRRRTTCAAREAGSSGRREVVLRARASRPGPVREVASAVDDDQPSSSDSHDTGSYARGAGRAARAGRRPRRARQGRRRRPIGDERASARATDAGMSSQRRRP